jgi:hypothetical protein
MSNKALISLLCQKHSQIENIEYSKFETIVQRTIVSHKSSIKKIYNSFKNQKLEKEKTTKTPKIISEGKLSLGKDVVDFKLRPRYSKMRLDHYLLFLRNAFDDHKRNNNYQIKNLTTIVYNNVINSGIVSRIKDPDRNYKISVSLLIGYAQCNTDALANLIKGNLNILLRPIDVLKRRVLQRKMLFASLLREFYWLHEMD